MAWKFDSNGATAETIREQDNYSGIRVTLGGTLPRAEIRFHVDVNIGDPIWPGPQQISVPRLIDGVIVVRGYPLEMVLAEKIVTALERGTANTRWQREKAARRLKSIMEENKNRRLH